MEGMVFGRQRDAPLPWLSGLEVIVVPRDVVHRPIARGVVWIVEGAIRRVGVTLAHTPRMHWREAAALIYLGVLP